MPEPAEARIAVLEARHAHHEKQFEDMVKKVDEMHSILLQAKGARWAILGVAGLAGFMAGKLSFLTTLFAGKM